MLQYNAKKRMDWQFYIHSGEGLGARFSSPDGGAAPGAPPFSSRPASAGSKSSLHTPDLDTQEIFYAIKRGF